MDVSKYIGRPYLKMGRGIRGFDCYGLVRAIAKDEGYPLPDYEYEGNTENMFADNFYKSVFGINKSERQAGDIVVLRYPVENEIHIGTLLNREEFIHTSKKAGVIISRLSDQWFARRIVGFFRIGNKNTND